MTDPKPTTHPSKMGRDELRKEAVRLDLPDRRNKPISWLREHILAHPQWESSQSMGCTVEGHTVETGSPVCLDEDKPGNLREHTSGHQVGKSTLLAKTVPDRILVSREHTSQVLKDAFPPATQNPLKRLGTAAKDRTPAASVATPPSAGWLSQEMRRKANLKNKKRAKNKTARKSRRANR